ncbi:MAG: metallophosphoesterase [archaeon]
MKKEISKGIEIIDLALFLTADKLLAITDLQLGYEGMLNSQGVFVPRLNFEEIKRRLADKIFPHAKGAEKILVNGDLKHEFGEISRQEWREVAELIELLKAHCKEVIIVKGNHDAILEPIAKSMGVKVVEHYFAEKSKTLFIHGHKEPSNELLKGAETIIIGHEHPAVSIKDGVKSETYKCFLRGKYKGKTLIVMPSLNFISMGSDITKEKILSPLIGNIDEFEVFAVEDKVYYMGKAGSI